MKFATPLYIIMNKVIEAKLARENTQAQLRAATEALKLLRSQGPIYAPPHELVALIEEGRSTTTAREKANTEHANCMQERDQAVSDLVIAQSMVEEAIAARDDLRRLRMTR